MDKKVFVFEVESRATGTMAVLARNPEEARKMADTLLDKAEGEWTLDIGGGDARAVGEPRMYAYTGADEDYREQAEKNEEAYKEVTE